MGNFGVSSGARGFQLQLLCHWNNGKTGINAKMMFDEAQVFKGLSAWFSASVPTRLRSQWGKNLTIYRWSSISKLKLVKTV